MKRMELGERLQHWHSSMHDPVYAVGSLFFDDKKYPDKKVVEHALRNLTEDQDKYQRMLNGEIISQYNSFLGRVVENQREFAGLSDEDLKDNIRDLEEIIAAVKKFYIKDYDKG